MHRLCTATTKLECTGLLLNFNAICPKRWKDTLIIGMLHRLYTVSQSWKCFHIECKKLTSILKKNNYPKEFIERKIKIFLDKKFKSNKKKDNEDTSDDKYIFVELPYIGDASRKLGKKLMRIYKSLGMSVQIVYRTMKVKQYFVLKTHTPKLMKSNVVYSFDCQVDPECQYVGKTKRRLHQLFENITRVTQL